MFIMGKHAFSITSLEEWEQLSPQEKAGIHRIHIGLDSQIDLEEERGHTFIRSLDAECPLLHTLSLCKSSSSELLELIESLPLTKLSIWTEELPKRIAMPKLRELSLFFPSAEPLMPLEAMIIQGESGEKVDFTACPLLEELSIYHAQRFDLNSLVTAPAIQRLRIKDCVLSDLAPLTALPLTDLTLASCYLTDVSALETIESLQSLNLYDNSIEKAASLCSLSALKFLELRRNPLQDEPDVRATFRGERLVISKQDAAVDRINEDIKMLRNQANRTLFYRVIQAFHPEQEKPYTKYQRRELSEEDYDTLLERQIRFEAKAALSRFDKSFYPKSSGFDYRSYYIERLKREYHFLRYDSFSEDVE